MNNFIEDKEFLELQPEVQKVFIEWWKPNQFDIYYHKQSKSYSSITSSYYMDIEFINKNKGVSYIPSFQMHHLIQFIEDKTGSKVDIDHHVKGYYISLGNKTKLESFYPTTKHDTLSALWEVAVRAATRIVLLAMEE